MLSKNMNTFNLTKRCALILCIVLGAITSACSTAHFPWVYRVDVDQGNIIDPEQLEQVTLGMTPRQVQFLLGTPLLQDPFNDNRWDYFYSYETGKGLITREGVTLFFDEGKLAEIKKREYPMVDRKF
ncbi:Outer membrane protein assembly factor BamE [BD1-7 clade bacterium]|uniref:Outer membrane protein assembly factor BamE n=1 Tax=BD1-7 clade bacterium TaxID=2029982 RepID=A0A5S9PBA9_9GAMM|nr:Outer membrane protein assembly factor BamE [BD1-7 clade bacterium]CAA0101724.1 Outer membrane protein assembly factor BamE [BD1-7 clade bacterium]